MLAAEWHLTLNDRGPEAYSPGSNRAAWWLCLTPECGNAWRMTISARIAGSGCPACSMAGRSMVEVRIAFELARFFPDVDPGKPFRIDLDGRTIRPDVLLSRDLRLIFEYDGHRFHTDVEKDRKRLELLANAGWCVIAAREKPLPLLNRTSFPVDGQRAFACPDEVARTALWVAKNCCGAPMSEAAEAYLLASGPVARDQADAFLATRKRRFRR